MPGKHLSLSCTLAWPNMLLEEGKEGLCPAQGRPGQEAAKVLFGCMMVPFFLQKIRAAGRWGWQCSRGEALS